MGSKSSSILTPLLLASLVFMGGCGYRFSGGTETTPFPADIKTVEIRSAINNTTITGIETELTNDMRHEFALGSKLKPVRTGGDVILNTLIGAYQDTPAAYMADGKELTRMGTLKLQCHLERAESKQVLWKKDFLASRTYLVTDSISGTLDNRRHAISQMIKDLIVRVQSSLYDDF